MAAGGQQGPGQSAMLGAVCLLPQPLAKGKGGSVGFVKAIPAACSGICFSTSPLPTPTPCVPPFSLAVCLFGREETAPTGAKDSGALPSGRLLGQWLCPVPYQPWGEAVRLEDWNFNAIIFSFVTFPLGRVSPLPAP